MNFRNKKGFTIIELIVVIAVLGILVLLALPRLTGYVERSQVTVIRHDVRVAENKIEEMLSDGNEVFLNENGESDWGEYVPEEKLISLINENKLYEKENPGLVDKNTLEDLDLSEYKVIPQSIRKDIKSKLPGEFYTDAGGKVYYEREKAGKEPIEPELKCNLIGAGDNIKEFFIQDKFFLTSTNKLYAVDASTKNKQFLMAENVGMVSESTNIGGTHYIMYDTNEGIMIRRRDGYDDGEWEKFEFKLADGRIKDIHGQLILTTDNRLYKVNSYTDATLIDTGVKKIIKDHISYNSGYINSQDEYVLENFGNFKNIGKYNNITYNNDFNVSGSSAYFMVSNGKLYSRGDNKYGHIGNLTAPLKYDVDTIYEVSLPNGTKIIDMVLYDTYSFNVVFALADNGNVYEWGGYNRGSRTPTLYATNVKAISTIQGIQGEEWSLRNVLLHYNDNSIDVVKEDSSKQFYNEPLLNNVSSITYISWMEIMIKTGDELHFYSRDLRNINHTVENVEDFKVIQGENDEHFIHYKLNNGKYYKYDFETTVEIDKYYYDNILGFAEVYDSREGKKIFIEVFKDKLCNEHEESYSPGD